MAEFAAGADQKVVTYYSEDSGDQVDLEAFAEGIAVAAAELGSQGWRVVSTSMFALRQVGTIGNVMFQSGGQMATQLAAVVVYSRA